MSLNEFGLLLLAILTASGGQFLLKVGALKLGRVNLGNLVSHVFSIATTPELLVGLILYALSSVLYILLLTRVPLSIVGPTVAIGYVLSVLIGYFFFKETIIARQLVGLGLIICGVTLLAWKQ
ncbi:MAG TPA: EamA family transporter [Coleofasciculaceae cyanobacterium]